MTVSGIQRKADIFVDAVALRTILVFATDHVALQYEGLHLIAPGRHERTGLSMQVDQLIALIHMECRHVIRLRHKDLLFHSRLCRQRTRRLAQIPDFIPLVLGKGYRRSPAMGAGQRRCHLFVYCAVRLAAALIHADNRFADTQPTLVTGRVTAAAIQRPGSFRFIESAVGVIRHHGMAGLGADTVALRHEHGLVVVAAEGCGFVFLPDGALAAAFTAGTDLQRDGRQVFHPFPIVFHAVQNQRDIAAARTASAGQRLYLAVLCDFHPAISRMIFQSDGGRHDSGPEGRRTFFLISDAPRIGGVFGAKTCGFQNARRVMCLCTESGGHLLGHIHPLPALIVQADSSAAACRSSAAFSTGGSSLPRTEALRRIPRHAFGLK